MKKQILFPCSLSNKELAEEVINRRQKYVRFVMRIGFEYLDAESIVVDVIVKAFSKDVVFVNMACLDSWVFKSCRNLAYDSLSKEKTKRGRYKEFSYLQEESYDPTVDDKASGVLDSISEMIKKEAEKLPARCKLVFDLTFGKENVDYRKVGAQIGMSYQTVLNQRCIGLEIIRKQLRSKIY